MSPISNILHTTPLILACLASCCATAEDAAKSIYSPLESTHEIAPDNAFFPGATLAVYDPIDPAVDSKISPKISQPETSAPAPHSFVAHGEISPPPSRPLTENLVTNLSWSLGAIALSSTLDRGGDTFARQHGQSSVARNIAKVGNALPFIAFGLAGLAFLDDDPRLSRTGLAAMQAGGFGAASGLGLKYAFARARPELNQGPSQFHAAGTKSGDSSMPSIHSAMAWGVITPFAKEYDMPWLYGVAAMTNLARVTDRKHWVSDTVAGGLLGYWMGDIAWHYNRQDDRSNGPQVSMGSRNLALGWKFN